MSRIINEKLDIFYKRASEHLKREQPNLFPAQADIELKKIIAFQFNNSIIKSYISFRKILNY